MTEQQRLFDMSEHQIQKHLKATCEYLGFDGVSTHSFRKYFATQIYINNGYNIELVRQLLQHSSAAVTQRYIAGRKCPAKSHNTCIGSLMRVYLICTFTTTYETRIIAVNAFYHCRLSQIRIAHRNVIQWQIMRIYSSY